MLSLFVLLIAIVMMVLTFAADAIMRRLPFVSGLIGVLFLIYSFPRLKDVIPGEATTSIFAIIVLVELTIFVLLRFEQTSGPVTIASSMFFIGIAMIIYGSSIEFATWQKAVFVTFIYVLSAGIVLASNLMSTKVDCSAKRNIFTSIIASVLYAIAAGINIFVILGCIWAKYIKANFSQSFYNSFDIGGLVVIVIGMIATAIISIIRDLSQTPQNEQVIDKIIQ
ncbi:hypothetical protein [Butyrivibrio sp. VCB2001]|uniref:hypothetical protein n=1 Tax=Butyrivibrio sp. VCB2001 TaxID=1280667 RepID=UPI0003FAE24C|nr:hypothetical protein [Butyrivibrio sp. VCB2001]